MKRTIHRPKFVPTRRDTNDSGLSPRGLHRRNRRQLRAMRHRLGQLDEQLVKHDLCTGLWGDDAVLASECGFPTDQDFSANMMPDNQDPRHLRPENKHERKISLTTIQCTLVINRGDERRLNLTGNGEAASPANRRAQCFALSIMYRKDGSVAMAVLDNPALSVMQQCSPVSKRPFSTGGQKVRLRAGDRLDNKHWQFVIGYAGAYVTVEKFADRLVVNLHRHEEPALLAA